MANMSCSEKYDFIFNRMNISIDVNCIMYLEIINRKIVVHTTGKVFEFYSKMSDEENRLSGLDFIRVHNSYLVNMKYISEIKGNQVILINREEVPLSRNRKRPVFESFLRYISNST